MMHRANSDSFIRVSAFGVPPPRHSKNLIWKHSPGTTDCERGALLLMDFKHLVTDELQHTRIESLSIPTMLPRISAVTPPTRPENLESDTTTHEQGKLSSSSCRPRTVSVSFEDAPMSPLPFSPAHSYDSSSSSTLGSPASLTHELSVEVTPDTRKTVLELPADLKEAGALLGRSTSSKLVGTEVIGPVKAVLQRKFSWKTYPELEGYLVKHREEYLQYSSECNYTAEQKKFNNGLTQGLLDLAKEEGYLFEDFSFAAIRDRIRCYYKSYVQATKKKKKRKRF